MDALQQNTIEQQKRQRGRPRLTTEQKELRKQVLKEQNVERMRELRRSKPELVSSYSKKYYSNHKDDIRTKRSEMYKIYTLYKQGAITV
jgi:uncharacterized membrane protein YccC